MSLNTFTCGVNAFDDDLITSSLSDGSVFLQFQFALPWQPTSLGEFVSLSDADRSFCNFACHELTWVMLIDLFAISPAMSWLEWCWSIFLRFRLPWVDLPYFHLLCLHLTWLQLTWLRFVEWCWSVFLRFRRAILSLTILSLTMPSLDLTSVDLTSFLWVMLIGLFAISLCFLPQSISGYSLIFLI